MKSMKIFQTQIILIGDYNQGIKQGNCEYHYYSFHKNIPKQEADNMKMVQNKESGLNYVNNLGKVASSLLQGQCRWQETWIVESGAQVV
ncbi:unnamed protein product [Paramecium octaurelia]|uniref:Uncharacterized protein n=1 Tax=Paramecium octaurelia TaxID=43137 RepID=A0A8S1Y950_PAROT|nr:unnamed protein product [Paramecium octaurelia]